MNNINELRQFLGQKYKYIDLANVLKIDPATVTKLSKKGVIEKDQTMLRWLRQYVKHLQDVAGSRGQTGTLADERARTIRLQGDAIELKIAQEAGRLVPVSEIEPALSAMVTAARQEFLSLPKKIAFEIQGRYKVDIDESWIEGHILTALKNLAHKDLTGIDKPEDLTHE